MRILKSLSDTTLLTPYEQYFIQTLYKKGQLIPEQSPGEKNPLVQLAIDPTYIPLTETKQLPSYRTRTAKLQRSEPLPATPTGTYRPIHLIYIIEPTH
jgi:hypothetical protein